MIIPEELEVHYNIQPPSAGKRSAWRKGVGHKPWPTALVVLDAIWYSYKNDVPVEEKFRSYEIEALFLYLQQLTLYGSNYPAGSSAPAQVV